jgi:hypothetical protein
VIVVLTADTDLVAATPIVSQPVPLFIYVYAVTGALGYVFTVVGERRLTSSDKSTDTDTVQTMLTDYSTDNDPSDPRVSSADRADQPIKPSLIYDWSIRVLAAIPLASAVFLLVSLLLPQSQLGATEVVVRTADGAVSVNETGVSGQLNETSSVQDVDIERRRRSDPVANIYRPVPIVTNKRYVRPINSASRGSKSIANRATAPSTPTIGTTSAVPTPNHVPLGPSFAELVPSSAEDSAGPGWSDGSVCSEASSKSFGSRVISLHYNCVSCVFSE